MDAVGATASAIATDPAGSLGSIWSSFADPIADDWSAGNYGEAIGRSITGVLATIFTGKGLGKVDKAGKVPSLHQASSQERKKLRLTQGN